MELLHCLQERLPQEKGLEEFLEDAYNELAMALEDDKVWGERSEAIAEFL